MSARSTLIPIADRAFVLGHGDEWSGRPIKADRLHDVWRIRSGKKDRGRFAVSSSIRRRDVYSLAALFASLSPTVFCLVELDGQRAWVLQTIDGSISPDTDRIYSIDTEQSYQNVTDIMQEASQIVTAERVLHFRSRQELEDYLEPILKDMSAKQLKSLRLARQNLDSIIKMSAFMMVAGALYYGYQTYDQSIRAKRAEAAAEARIQQLIQQNERERQAIVAMTTPERIIPMLKEAMSHPNNIRGFEVASVSCQDHHCTTVYQNKDALLASPAYLWALEIDPHATLDSTAKSITMNYTVTAPEARPITRTNIREASLGWADIMTVTDFTGAKFSVSDLALLPGSMESGTQVYKGQWNVSSVPLNHALTLVEALNRVPGLRYQTFRMQNGSISLGGIYAIDNDH